MFAAAVVLGKPKALNGSVYVWLGIASPVLGGGADQVAQGGLELLAPLALVAGVADDAHLDDQVVGAAGQGDRRRLQRVVLGEPFGGDHHLLDALGCGRRGGEQQGGAKADKMRELHGTDPPPTTE